MSPGAEHCAVSLMLDDTNDVQGRSMYDFFASWQMNFGRHLHPWNCCRYLG